jgi:hypothetical protein
MADALELNCECDDDWPSETLLDLRKYLMTRLGFAAMLNTPPPGMVGLCNSFIDEAQKLLYRRYAVLRTGRWFTWNMTAGTRFYDLGDNADACSKKLDPRRVSWVGVSKGDDVWQTLLCGIDPTVYSSRIQSFPQRYEIRQCIEVWPAPADDTWLLRLKGDFGLAPLVQDDDTTTVDADAIKLLALANAKAHYGQPDAPNYMTQLTTLLGDLNSGSHLTRRYIPGERRLPNAVPPKLVGGYQP